MSETTDQIIEQLKSLTLLEAAELVTSIEETFSVSSSAPQGLATAMPAAAAAPVEEEKTEFTVILEGVPSSTNRLKVIKAIRVFTSLGLKDAKDLVETAPKAVKEDVSKAEAQDIKKQLEEAGASAEIK